MRAALAVALLAACTQPLPDRSDASTDLCPGALSADCDLDGACDDLSEDRSRCGACDRACAINETCVTGECQRVEVVDLSVGSTHVCVALEDGRVACWGSSTHGELGDGGAVDSSSPVEVVGIDDAIALFSGVFGTCAVHELERRASCWGANFSGRFDASSRLDRNRPVPLEDAVGIEAIDMGNGHLCWIADGALFCRGTNERGQLGDGMPRARVSPAIPVSPFDGSERAVRAATGSAIEAAFTCVANEDGVVYCVGDNDVGSLGRPSGPDDLRMLPVSGADASRGLVAMAASVCALAMDGSVSCWGEDDLGQTGSGLEGGDPVFVPTPLTGVPIFETLGAGSFMGLATTEDAVVYGWGDGDTGVFDPAVPVATPRVIHAPAADSRVIEVGGGSGFACALVEHPDATREVWCAGSNTHGQLGLEPRAPRPWLAPVPAFAR